MAQLKAPLKKDYIIFLQAYPEQNFQPVPSTRNVFRNQAGRLQ